MIIYHLIHNQMSFKLFILSLVAVLCMSTQAFAKGKKTVNSADNNVSPDTEQVDEHDLNVYGSAYTDGDKFSGLTRKVGFDRMIPPHALAHIHGVRPVENGLTGYVGIRSRSEQFKCPHFLNIRSMLRLSSRSLIDWRLSYCFLPRPIPMTSLA